MAKLLKLRRGTTSQHSSFTGAEGEVTVDTTKDTLVVHDGSTAGGVPLAKESANLSLIDEDNMSSNSATRPPSQQSVKAYADTKASPPSSAGTVGSSEVCQVDSNKDITGFRNITLTGELDAATGDFSGDVDIDGTCEADAYTVDGTALNEYIADTVGAMVGSNTETGISVSYDDADNTLDFVVATLNQDTTGTAAIATTVTVADVSSDTTCFPLFATAATGNLGPKSGSNLTFNSSSGVLTATGFAGPITGNVTGNASGSALTVTQAAQSAITSVGTLTAISVDGPYRQVGEAVGGTAIDTSTGNYFTKTISGNTTFTFTNPAASGTVTAFTLELTHSSGSVTWPSEVKWNADTAPSLTTGKTHLFMFVSDDNGSRWRGSALVDYVN